jgi:hypothetical protein
MRLDLRHEIVERLGGVGRAGALRQRKIAKARRAQREINRERYERQSHQGQDRRGAAQTEVRYGRWITLVIRRSQQTAADFDARGLGFGGTDQTRGEVAIDLRELILIDGFLAAIVLRPPAAAQRPQHGENRSGRHQREHKPQSHQAVSGGTTPTSRRRCAALHHRRQAGQLTNVHCRQIARSAKKPGIS